MTALANSKIQYVGSVEWGNVAAYPGAGSVAAGTLCTNTANSPALGSERVFVCTTGGTSLGTAPTFTVTKGAITEEGSTGVFWQECTGQPGVNGDTTNSPVWGATLTVVLGQIIYDSTSGSLQIANNVSGFTTGSVKPTFSATAGVTTPDNSVNNWTSLGLASSFGAWAAPHKHILNADAATWQTVIPATIFISSDHAETQSSALTLAGGQGTNASPNRYLSVSNAVANPSSCTAGASVATTGASNLLLEGYGYYNGITFSSGGGGSNAGQIGISSANAVISVQLENCTLSLATTSTTQDIVLGASAAIAATVILLNCTFTFSSTSQAIQPDSGTVILINPTIAATGSVPANAFRIGNAQGVNCTVRDADLSKITGFLYQTQGNTSTGTFLFENCKLASGVVVVNGTLGVGPGGVIFKLHNCDSGTKNYRFYQASFLGTIQQETTIVDTTNPASNGTTNISWNIATSANTSFGQPYGINAGEIPEITQWCALTTGSHTATIQINSNIALTNAQIWMELECLDNSSFPIGSAISSRATDPLTSPTTYTTSTDSWGGSETHQQYMQVSFSPAMAGYIKARIYVTDPSITVYVNPLIIIV